MDLSITRRNTGKIGVKISSKNGEFDGVWYPNLNPNLEESDLKEFPLRKDVSFIEYDLSEAKQVIEKKGYVFVGDKVFFAPEYFKMLKNRPATKKRPFNMDDPFGFISKKSKLSNEDKIELLDLDEMVDSEKTLAQMLTSVDWVNSKTDEDNIRKMDDSLLPVLKPTIKVLQNQLCKENGDPKITIPAFVFRIFKGKKDRIDFSKSDNADRQTYMQIAEALDSNVDIDEILETFKNRIVKMKFSAHRVSACGTYKFIKFESFECGDVYSGGAYNHLMNIGERFNTSDKPKMKNFVYTIVKIQNHRRLLPLTDVIPVWFEKSSYALGGRRQTLF